MVHGDLGQQALEAEPDVSRAAALPEVLVDDEDTLGGPAQGAGVIGQGILAGERFAVLGDLLRRGLADIHDGQLGPMGIGDLDGLEGRGPRRGFSSVRRAPPWRRGRRAAATRRRRHCLRNLRVNRSNSKASMALWIWQMYRLFLRHT